MKCISLFFLLVCLATTGLSQTTDELLQQYADAVRAIDVASYQVQSIDTFTTGDVWNNTGHAILKREKANPLFGFAFYGKRADVATAALYNGNTFFEINTDTNKYTATPSPGQGILGSPGGQMVVKELLEPVQKYEGVTHTTQEGAYVLRYSFAGKPEYDIKNVYKLVYLDRNTFLPIKIVYGLTMLGKQQVNIDILNNLAINAAVDIRALATDILATYSQEEVPDTRDHLAELVGQAAAPFTLKSFDNQPVSLESLKGKMVLLDFWEVWCGPCVQAMPKMQAIADKYKKDGLVVLGITHEQNSVESAKKLLAKKQARFVNLIGDESLKKNYKVNGVPEYVLIDETGKIVFASSGYNEQLDALLKAKYNH